MTTLYGKTTHFASESGCRGCGHPFDAATLATDGAPVSPKAGDVSMCIYCGTLSIYADEAGATRAPTDAEWAEIAQDDRARAAILRGGSLESLVMIARDMPLRPDLSDDEKAVWQGMMEQVDRLRADPRRKPLVNEVLRQPLQWEKSV